MLPILHPNPAEQPAVVVVVEDVPAHVPVHVLDVPAPVQVVADNSQIFTEAICDIAQFS